MEGLLNKFIDELLKSYYLQLYTLGLVLIILFLNNNIIATLHEYFIQFEMLRKLFDYKFLVLALYLLYTPVFTSSIAKIIYFKIWHKKFDVYNTGLLNTIKKSKELLSEADKVYNEMLHCDVIKGSKELLEKCLLKCDEINEFDYEIKKKLAALSLIKGERKSDTSFKFFFSLNVAFIFLWVVLFKYARLHLYEFDILLFCILFIFILNVGVMLYNMYVDYTEKNIEKKLEVIHDSMASIVSDLSNFIDKHIKENSEV